MTACVRGCVTERHLNECPRDDCRGCLPRLAAIGLQVCGPCERRVSDGLREIPALHDALLTPTKAGGRQGRITGSPEPPQPMRDEPRWEREAIRAMLVSWCLLMAEDYGMSLPADTVQAMAGHVHRQTIRLLAGEHADQLTHDVTLAVGDARRRAYPSRPDWAVIGEHACGGLVRARASTGTATCDGCTVEAVIDWWRQELPSSDDDLLTDREAQAWLLLAYGRQVSLAAVRQWASRGLITRSDTMRGKEATTRRADLRRHAEDAWLDRVG